MNIGSVSFHPNSKAWNIVGGESINGPGQAPWLAFARLQGSVGTIRKGERGYAKHKSKWNSD